MKQALVLCGGKALRLQPYSYGLPKACMPFLNLPLLSLGWFYLEQLKVSHFFLNAHLFPEKLKQTVDFLSQPQQKTNIFFEAEPLGGAGTLYSLKKFLQKEEMFFYLNGDSLFFPSDEDQFSFFEKDFYKTGADGSFFVSPLPFQDTNFGALWCDTDLNLKFVGKKEQLPKGFEKLLPFHFSGLALFKSALLDNLNSSSFHLFRDLINPLIEKKNFKVFLDKKAIALEAGEKQAYIESLKFCLKCLFEPNSFSVEGFGAGDLEDKLEGSENREGKGERTDKIESESFGMKDFKNRKLKLEKLFEKYFHRFDPKDQIVGFENGKVWSKKLGFPLLAPKSVQGMENLELRGFAVLGSKVNLFGKSWLKDSVLGSILSWKGELNNDIILKFFPK